MPAGRVAYRAMIIRAAGGVLWREEDGETLVAVVHRPRHDDWSLPKGRLDEGEDEQTAAVREVLEETGARVEVGEDLGAVDYIVTKDGRTRPKTVRYWAMRFAGGGFEPSGEVDALDWLPVTDAAGRLSYARDRQVLARFTAAAADGREPSGPPGALS
jgi:8-oxo-dGTP pyrophosphatase MutT (NUDIX family)